MYKSFLFVAEGFLFHANFSRKTVGNPARGHRDRFRVEIHNISWTETIFRPVVIVYAVHSTCIRDLYAGKLDLFTE